jgi:hypothetical protein
VISTGWALKTSYVAASDAATSELGILLASFFAGEFLFVGGFLEN